jgi:hypothetical protein
MGETDTPLEPNEEYALDRLARDTVKQETLAPNQYR